MKKYILTLLIILSLAACGKKYYTYPQNMELSDKGGAIIDTIGGHLLNEITFDGQTYNADWNKETATELNQLFLETKEPVLFNYYQDRDIFRVVIQEKEKAPLILSINKGDKNTWIVSKIYRTNVDLSALDLDIDSTSINDQSLLESSFNVFSKELKEEQIQTFDSLFQKTDFYHLPVGEVSRINDTYCLFEAHQAKKYWFVYRSVEDNSLKELITYMRSLSAFKE